MNRTKKKRRCSQQALHGKNVRGGNVPFLATPRSLTPRNRAFSLLEVVIAFAVLVTAMMPMLLLFGTTTKAVNKSQNLTLAVGLAHKITQHLHAIPYDQIVDQPEKALADGPVDHIFNPLENSSTSQAGNIAITKAQMPHLYGFLKKHRVAYALDVVGDMPKDVKILVTWQESGKNLMYSQRVYVTKH